ncbi:S8/S53 family peptidase [Mesorhizobium sp. M0136]|uniref:S8/S53 family peptidase n=1 Tax=Mesorhizobium sp. M0136 TaxID=2956890 RepID=UPI00333BA0F0
MRGVSLFLRLFLASVATIALAESCRAQSKTPGDEVYSSGVVVSLDGGLVSSNLAKVLDLLEAAGVALPSRPLTIQAGGSVCQLLLSMGYPPPCDPLLPRVEKLNRRFSGNFKNIAAGESIQMPAVDLTTLWQEKSVYRREDTQEYLDGIKKNWRDLSVVVLPNNNDDFMRTFQYSRYKAVFPIKDFSLAQIAYSQLLNSDIPNMTVSLRGAGSSTVTLHSGFDDSGFDDLKPDYVNGTCKQGKLWPDLNYIDIVDSDPDADRLYQEARARGARGEPTQIYMMDSPLAPSGNLGRALGAAQVEFDTIEKRSCKWVDPFVKERDHANLLAGIIADQEKTGFQGLWPYVLLESYDIVKEDPDREEHVMSHLRDGGLRPSLDVYLFASDFEVNSGTGPFKNEDMRQKTSGASVVPGFTNIIIAAAPTNVDGPVTLSATTSNFPQTWGDHDSVIIVSSCDDCRRDSATLSQNAAASVRDVDAVKFVHVAAPGGGHIIGWVGNSSIATTQGGTSQAVAFVAGVVSSMISTYPLIYRKPVLVKYRIQQCSYPLNAYRNGVDNEDYGKLAAGVIDPKVCLLDPSQTWIKVGHTWKSVDFGRWSDKSNFGPGLAPADVLRVVKMPGKSGNDVEWRIYSKRQVASKVRDASKGLGAIKQWRDVEISADTKFTTCDGQHEYRLLSLSDFMVAIDSRSRPCQPVVAASGSNLNASN